MEPQGNIPSATSHQRVPASPVSGAFSPPLWDLGLECKDVKVGGQWQASGLMPLPSKSERPEGGDSDELWLTKPGLWAVGRPLLHHSMQLRFSLDFVQTTRIWPTTVLFNQVQPTIIKESLESSVSQRWHTWGGWTPFWPEPGLSLTGFSILLWVLHSLRGRTPYFQFCN